MKFNKNKNRVHGKLRLDKFNVNEQKINRFTKRSKKGKNDSKSIPIQKPNISVSTDFTRRTIMSNDIIDPFKKSINLHDVITNPEILLNQGTTKFDYKEWFRLRNLSIRDYQLDVLEKLENVLNTSEPIVLGSCPNSGKTIIAISFIERYLKQFPSHKVLILSHGTKVLRTQFHNECVAIQPNFSFKEIGKKGDLEMFDKNVAIAISQTLNSIEGNFELIVIDEAHHFYIDSKRTKALIEKIKPLHQLLLTGTPSPFVLNKSKIIDIPLSVLVKSKLVSDLNIDIYKGKYDCDIEDFNQFNELHKDVIINKLDISNTIDGVLNSIKSKLNISDSDKLPKTLVACNSIKQAESINQILLEKNINSIISTSNNDKEGLFIEKFEKDSTVEVMVVVMRGILGFNMPDLINVVDFTYSLNIDRIYQLFSRVLRKSPTGGKKNFIKVTPSSMETYYRHILNASLCLSQSEYLLKYNGKNFKDLNLLVFKNEYDEVVVKAAKNKIRRVSKPVYFETICDIELFETDIIKSESFAYTTIGNIKDITFSNTRTDEELMNISKKYDGIPEWKDGDYPSYISAKRRDLLPQIIIENGWAVSTKAKAKYSIIDQYDAACKYSSKSEWRKNEKSTYNSANNNNAMKVIDFVRFWHVDDEFNMILQSLIKEKIEFYGSKEVFEKADYNLYLIAVRFQMI